MRFLVTAFVTNITLHLQNRILSSTDRGRGGVLGFSCCATVLFMSSVVVQMKGPLLGELQEKVEETEVLKMELQMLETERVRLSLVEEKLLDVLQLLQQLRDLVWQENSRRKHQCLMLPLHKDGQIAYDEI